MESRRESVTVWGDTFEEIRCLEEDLSINETSPRDRKHRGQRSAQPTCYSIKLLPGTFGGKIFR